MSDSVIVKEKPDSIEVSCNAKGDYSWKIKVYYNLDSTAIEFVVNKCNDLNEELKKRFN